MVSFLSQSRWHSKWRATAQHSPRKNFSWIDDSCVPQTSALFHPSDRHALELSFMVRNVAAALVGVAQLGGEPAVFAVIAGCDQSGAREPDIFAGGKIRTGRQNVIDFTAQDAVDIDHALSATVGVTQYSGRFMPVIAFADGVQRGALHMDVFAGFSIRARRLDGGPAFAPSTDQATVFVGNIGGAILIVGKAGVVRFAFFVLAVGTERAFFHGNVRAALLVRTLWTALLRGAAASVAQKHGDNEQTQSS